MTKVGDQFGNIRIVGQLGAGGMGEVYEGYDETLQRRVALKTIRAGSRLSDDARARFLREARILSKLEHPNICRIHDFVTEGNTESLVLEFIEGRTLDKALKDEPAADARMRIALAIADVLAAAHAEGIIHRDLKPANVMLTPDGQVKVLDFGLAREGLTELPEASDEDLRADASPTPDASTEAAEATEEISQDETVYSEDQPTVVSEGWPSAGQLTRLGSVVGTPLYMSPEQARGEPLHTASDMYSFGLLLQTLFTGKFPYDRKLPTDELARCVIRGETLPVTGVDSELATLIERLKARAPAARPTAVDVRARLEWIRDRPKRRLRRLAVAAVVAVIVLGGLKYMLDLRRERTIAVEARQTADVRREQAEDLIGFMLGDLRKKLEPLGRLEILDDVGDNAMAYFAAIDRNELSDEELSSRSRALYQIGEVRIAQGNLAAAVEPLSESLSLARLLVDRDPGDGDRMFEAGQSHFWVGFVHWRRGDLDAALEEFRGYLDLSTRLVEMDPANLGWRLELAYAHSNIGSVLEQRGDLEGALEKFETALNLKKELVAADPDNTDWRHDVARSHNTVGSIFEFLGNYNAALEHYMAELEIKEALAASQPSHASWQYELAITHNFIGMLREAMGDVDAGIEQFRASLEKLTALTERDPSNSTWKRELAATLSIHGDACRKAGRLAPAAESLESAMRQQAELVAKDPTDVGWKLDLAASHTRIGKLLAGRGDLDGARAAGLEALEILQPLASEKPDDPAIRRSMSSVHALLGSVWSLSGDGTRAAAAWKKAVDFIEALARESSDRRVLEPWVRALLYLGRREEARPAFERLASYGYKSTELQQKWDALAAQAASGDGAGNGPRN